MFNIKNKSIKYIVQAAVIAGIYAAITIALSPLSYGPIQIRASEALTVLPALTPAGIPGLFIGCIISNILSPYGLLDLICGSLATLIAAFFSCRLREKPLLVPLPPIIANGLIIGIMLKYAYGVPFPLPLCILSVAAGEMIACYAIGYPLYKVLKNNWKDR